MEIESMFDLTAFPRLVEGKTVAVVGNSPTAVKFPHAERIDACDVVVRFNRFELGPRFSAVGKKTTVVSLPFECLRSFLPEPELTKINPALVFGVCARLDASVVDNLRLLRGRKLGLLPMAHFNDLSRELNRRPTTGFATLTYLVSTCRPASVYATGFSFQKMPRDHYFDGCAFDYTVHDPVRECRVFATMWNQLLVRVDPHMQECLRQARYTPRHGRSGKHSAKA